jgi:hypothetical protein
MLTAFFILVYVAFIAAMVDWFSKGKVPFQRWQPVLIGALCGLAIRLVYWGNPGGPWSAMNSAFIFLAPLAVGAVTVYVAERSERRSWSYYFTAGVAANVLFILGSMLVLVEGLICAIIILPVFAIYGALGALVMGYLCRKTNWPRHGVYSFAFLPFIVGAIAPNGAGESHVERLEHTVVIHATPAAIWQHLHHASDIAPDEMGNAWMYKIGVPLPKSAVTEESAFGRERKIIMGKQIHFTQVVTEWEENRYVRWTYRFDADSFPPQALDDHVRIGGEYFDLIDTAYTLTPKPNGDTELKVSMQYRVSTQFNWYAKRVARLLIGNFEHVALDFYARRAE